MRKVLVLLLAALGAMIMFGGSAFSEAVPMDLAGMSIDELLSLRDSIDSLLEEKGHKVYFDIERGTKGEAVSAIQERLCDLGFYSGRITGKYDSQTQKAFKGFEKANGLENDGLASREDQIILFSVDAMAKATPVPETTADAQARNTAASESEHDVNFDYEQCMRFPDQHRGEKYRLKGKVEQTIGNRTAGFKIRFSVLSNSNEIIYVYINKDPGYNILEGDRLIIDLTMAGTVTYESIWGQEITIPAAIAENVVLR